MNLVATLKCRKTLRDSRSRISGGLNRRADEAHLGGTAMTDVDDALPALRRDAVDLGPGHAAHDLNPIASVHSIGIPCDYASRSLGDARLREQPLDGGRVLRMEDPHDLGTCERAVEPRRDGARLDEFERGRASNALCFSIASAASPAKAATMSESLSAPVLTLDPSFPKKSGEPKGSSSKVP